MMTTGRCNFYVAIDSEANFEVALERELIPYKDLKGTVFVVPVYIDLPIPQDSVCKATPSKDKR